MNGQAEEAAFVDSFFLPDGILEEEEELKDEAPPSLWSGAPPENPWANEVPLQTSWNTPQQQQQQEEPPLELSMRAQAATDIMPVSNSNGSPGIIGNSSYESSGLVSGPLHGSDLMRETLQARIGVGTSVPPAANTPSSGLVLQSNYPFRPEAPSHTIPEKSGATSQTLPFRPPPGFTQQDAPPIRIQQDSTPPPTPTDHNDDDDGSIRSNSSVPLELYDREFLSTSSLSGSSSVDETQSSWTPNTSSVVEEGSKQHLNDTVQREERTKQISNQKERIKENDEKRNGKSAKEQTTTTKTEHQESNDANVSPKPPPTSPVTKSRNRRGNKARRNKQHNTTTKNESTTLHTTSQSQQKCPSYLDNAHAALDWTAGLMEHMLGVLQCGISRVLLVFKSTSSFWTSLLIFSVGVLFEAIRILGILLSFCILICQSAMEEATQEWRVFLYFVIMNYTPRLTCALMETVVLPHWIPHVISCAVVYGLCRGRKQDDTQEIPTAHRISQITLRQVRLNLPMVFFIEGFSYEMGTAMALDPCGRLVVAYMILILRLGLLFSPMAWLCGAIQVLMACYLYWIPFVDVCILLIGLASVRYAKFLEQCNQAARDIRAKEKE